MLRPYVSKSSLETYLHCGLKFLLNYHLNKRDPPRKKTQLGVAVHIIAEILGQIKKEIQTANIQCPQTDEKYTYCEGVLENTELGNIEWNEYDVMSPSLLTEEEVDKINKSRKNKKTYIGDCNIRYGQVRLGREFVKGLIEKVWIKITTDKENDVGFWNQEWEESDKNDLINYTWLLLECFEPRLHTIVDLEKSFDLPIEHPDCFVNGEYIRVKGFIDVVYQEIPGTLSFLDFKTGERKDFSTGQEKNLESLSTDLQLCLYKYAIKKLYPDVKHIIGSICFIRDGGMFTPEFADDSDEYIFRTIHEHIKELRTCEQPTVLSETRDDFRCRYLCGGSKSFDYSKDKCNCQFIKEKIRENGIQRTIEEYK